MKELEKDRYEEYARNLAHLLREAVSEAQLYRSRAPTQHERWFFAGKMFALAELVTRLQEDAPLFDLGLKDVELDEIDPEEIIGRPWNSH